MKTPQHMGTVIVILCCLVIMLYVQNTYVRLFSYIESVVYVMSLPESEKKNLKLPMPDSLRKANATH